MALSLQGWAQPPTGITTSLDDLCKQARLRTLFAAGIESPGLAFLVKTLHGLVHIAFTIFLVGLLLYLFHINIAVFEIAAVGVGLAAMVYAFLTVWAITHPDCPYSTPLSKVVTSIRVFWATYRDRHGKAVARQPNDRRTFGLPSSDDDLEQFFEALPGFLDSKFGQLQEPLDLKRLQDALIGFWTRTSTSIRVSESVKGQRLIICMRIIDLKKAGLSIAIPEILSYSVDLSGVSELVEIAHYLGTLRSGRTGLLVRFIISWIIWTKNGYDKRWATLVMDELEISENVFWRYLRNGDNLSLAHLTHITRKYFHGLLQHDSNLTWNSLTILSSLPEFDIRDTLPELRRAFCALWDEVVTLVAPNPG